MAQSTRLKDHTTVSVNNSAVTAEYELDDMRQGETTLLQPQSSPGSIQHQGSVKPPVPGTSRDEGAHKIISSRDSLSWLERWNLHANQRWLWESIALCVSTIAFTLMLWLLHHYDGAEAPTWPEGITLSSALAVTSTVMKGCMIFVVSEGLSQLKWMWFTRPRPLSDLNDIDSASRGPWGSLTFLIRRHRDFFTPLGAVIIVAAVILSPTVQQIVNPVDCDKDGFYGTAVMPIVQTVSMEDTLDDARVQAYIQSSLLFPDFGSLMAYPKICGRGDCNFTLPGGYYMNLALEYSCKDVSDRIRLQQDNINRSNFTYTDDERSRPPLVVSSEAMLATDGYGTLSQFLNNSIQNAEFFSFTALFYNRTLQPMANGFAVTCDFWPAVATLNANVTNGTLLETRIGSTKLKLAYESADDERKYWYLQRLPEILEQNGTRSSCAIENTWTGFSDEDFDVISGDIYMFYLKAPFRINKPRCNFLISPRSVEEITTILEIFFTNQTYHGSDPHTFHLAENFAKSHLIGLYADNKFNFSTVDAYAAGLAHGITAYMRREAVSLDAGLAKIKNPAVTVGKVRKPLTTCAKVRWVWITPSAVLLALTTIFVIGLARSSSRQGRQTNWPGYLKSSSLALLLHETDGGEFERFGGLRDQVLIDHEAKKIRTALRRRTVTELHDQYDS